MVWSRSDIEDIQQELFADDVSWSHDELRYLSRSVIEQFFVSGGVLPPPQPPPMLPPSISFASEHGELAAALLAAGRLGIIRITDLPLDAPFAGLQAVFDDAQASSAAAAPRAYYPKGFALKDNSGGAVGADRKRILDLNPKRLAAAQEALDGIGPSASAATDAEDPALEAFRAVVSFWRTTADTVAPKLRAAVTRGACCDAIDGDDHFDFRMVDYFEKEWSSRDEVDDAPPRCRAHRDFGSFTLIYAETAGLQAQLDAGNESGVGVQWRDVALPGPRAALLLYGWCTQIRSNGRLHAVQHRVLDGPEPQARAARRTSAVFFVSPSDMQAPLHPVVLDGEAAQYVDGVSAEAQQMYSMNPLARAKIAAAASPAAIS